MLSHYSQSKVSISKWEPVTVNLFEVTVKTPFNDDTALILEHVRSISGLQMNPDTDPIGQKYKQSDRSFAGLPGQTALDVEITFTCNLNDANQAYMYNIMRKWKDLTFNPQTGEMGLKKDYCGDIIVVQHNRKMDIYRKIVLKDVFPTKIDDGMADLNYDTSEPVEIKVTFRCDNYAEQSAGLNV